MQPTYEEFFTQVNTLTQQLREALIEIKTLRAKVNELEEKLIPIPRIAPKPLLKTLFATEDQRNPPAVTEEHKKDTQGIQGLWFLLNKCKHNWIYDPRFVQAVNPMILMLKQSEQRFGKWWNYQKSLQKWSNITFTHVAVAHVASMLRRTYPRKHS